MVGVALGEPRYFVDPLIGLLRVFLGVGLRLLLQVVELAHAILLCLTWCSASASGGSIATAASRSGDG
jgi:hypothetical protein